MQAAIDPDDVTTWPEALQAEVKSLLHGIEPGTHVDELGLPLGDDRVLGLLGGRPLRTYHATRLLPHEVESVKHDGLRMLTEKLIADRIDGALAAGCVTGDEAAALRAGNVFAVKDAADGRRDRVCAIAGATAFAEEPESVRLLLSTWGGEGIYWYVGEAMQTRLQSVGNPSIIVLDLPLQSARHLIFPGLAAMLAAHLGRLDRPGADVFYKGDVPASAVVDVWQPGMPEYDRFARLPR